MKLEKENWVAIKSPIGIVRVFEVKGKVAFIDIAASDARVGSSSESKILELAETELMEYFDGNRTAFTFPVELTHGTDFQQRVWKQIAKIPFGKTMTYAEIAKAIGKPLASRAVGGAVGANPVPLVVGCHRILGTGGRITGYSGGEGLRTKRWLLAHEGLSAKE